MPTKEELMGHRFTVPEIEARLKVDSLGYLSLEGMLGMVQETGPYCNACFSGEYSAPLVDLDKGLIWTCNHLKAVKIGEHDEHLGRVVTQDDIVIWDAKDPNPTLAFGLTQLREGIDPTPIGVLRAIEGPKAYDTMVHEQLAQGQAKKAPRSIEELLHSGKTWKV